MNAQLATSPKKKSLMPSGELRRRLRADAHALAPVVQIGKEGVTEPLLKQVARVLYDHELIKVKLGSESPETRFEAAERLAAEPGMNVVQILGRVVILYKRHPETPQYEKNAAPAKPVAKKKARRPARVEPPKRQSRQTEGS